MGYNTDSKREHPAKERGSQIGTERKRGKGDHTHFPHSDYKTEVGNLWPLNSFHEAVGKILVHTSGRSNTLSSLQSAGQGPRGAKKGVVPPIFYSGRGHHWQAHGALISTMGINKMPMQSTLNWINRMSGQCSDRGAHTDCPQREHGHLTDKRLPTLAINISEHLRYRCQTLSSLLRLGLW